MSLKNAKVLLTVNLGGRLDTTVSNSASKAEISKIKTSPFESEVKNSDGMGTGIYITSKGNYKSPNNFIEGKIKSCTRSVSLNEDTVNFLISDGSKPQRVKSQVWQKMTQEQRLVQNLQAYDEGFGISYEIITE